MKSDKKTAVITLFGLVCILLIVGYITYQYRSPSGFYAREHSDIRAVQQNKESPYRDLLGNAVTLQSFEGKPLVVNVWASWSPFSNNELNLLSKLSSEYGDKITMLAINRMEDSSRVQAYLESIGIPPGIVFLIDTTDNFYKTVGGFAMPETIFYDSFGNIKTHKRGVLTEEEVRAEIEYLIKKD